MVAARTDQDVNRLAEGAERIGDVVRLIRDIAEQTNLLALNATIEAARAGEAGKGFAVVASEVKTLASQTAKATEEIASQIGDIQGLTRNSVAAIGEITGTIREIEALMAAIAGAVEEQDGATQEISQSVTVAASGAHAVQRAVGEVLSAVAAAASEGEVVRAVAQRITAVSRELSTTVEAFLDGVTKEVDERRRELRFAAGDDVTIDLGAGPHRSRIVDISAGGAQVVVETSGLSMGKGQPVSIEWPGEGRVPATVVWSDDNRAGVAFQVPQPKLLARYAA